MNVREWALPIYTILMQLAVGALLMLWVIRQVYRSRYGSEELNRIIHTPLMILFFTAITAIIGSHFHLSKPFLSFLAIMNFRRSWLSREIIFTILFTITLATLLFYQRKRSDREGVKTLLGWLAVLLGFGTVFCMANIYLLPIQASWNTPVTIFAFFSSMILLGAVSLLAMIVMDLKFSELWTPDQVGARRQIVQQSAIWLIGISWATLLVIYLLNMHQIVSLLNGEQSAQTSLQLLVRLYRPLFMIRLVFPLVGLLIWANAIWPVLKRKSLQTDLILPAYMACILVAVGEILGRFLFYATHVRAGI